MWNERLASLIDTYHSAVLSSVESDGYPTSVRCQIRADVSRHLVTISDPPALAKNWRGRACLLFHEHDAGLESLRQLVVLGELRDEDGILTFHIEKFVTANGRTDSDQLPHASSPLHMLKFFFLGRRNARAYIAKRGKPWPPIPYDDIARSLAQESSEN
jgi:hypothetical protein